MNIRHGAGLLALLLAVVPAYADPYKEGRELYRAGRYAEAARKFEEAVQADPSNAKAWWQLNFAYNKLERYEDALRAVEKAGSLDPTYSFASTPEKYRETLERLRKKAGSRASSDTRRPSAELGPLSGPEGTLSQQLQKRGVFVQHGASVDVMRLQAVIRELEPVPVRFLVFSSTAGSEALAREADRVRRYLGLRDGYVIACSRGGVAASAQTLSRGRLQELTRQAAVRMEAGDATGALEDLARGLVATRVRQTQGQLAVGLVVMGGAGGLLLAWIIARRIANAKAMRARRAVAEQRKADVIAQINYLEDSRAVLAASVAERVQQARREAGTKLDEAARLMAKARDPYELTVALELLDQAKQSADYGRAVMDAALTGKPIPEMAAMGSRPPVYPAASTTGPDTDWSQIPEEERGVCFFCSRPALLAELKPVTVELEGARHRVLACADDYRSIRAGQPPRIRAFERDGRYVPWYADPDYDPYRDYYERGYGVGDAVRDMILITMIDRIFWEWDRPYRGWEWGGGYGPDWDGYTFWPEHHRYRDYYAERSAAGTDFGADMDRQAAGTDFLDTSGYDRGPYAGAGTDFLDRDES